MYYGLGAREGLGQPHHASFAIVLRGCVADNLDGVPSSDRDTLRGGGGD